MGDTNNTGYDRFIITKTPFALGETELSTTMKSVGFPVSNYLNHETISGIHNLLFLRNGFLEDIKCESYPIPKDTQFQVIFATGENHNVSEQVVMENVIISLIEPYQWELTDNLNPFITDTKDKYIVVKPDKKNNCSEMDMLAIAIELSYTFGVQFRFNNHDYAETSEYYLYMDDNILSSNYGGWIFDTLALHKKELEDSYKAKIEIVRNNLSSAKESKSSDSNKDDDFE